MSESLSRNTPSATPQPAEGPPLSDLVIRPGPNEPRAGAQHDHTDDTTSLDRLVTQFVAAKRALASTTAVYRANELVSQSRHHVEARAVLEAKNAFLQHGLEAQMSALHRVRADLTHVGKEAQLEFEDLVKNLDIANDRLQATLASLHKTRIRSQVRDELAPETDLPKGSREASKTLYDFIDETTHQGLLDSLRQLIDSYNVAQGTLNSTAVSLQGVTDELDQTLRDIGKMTSEQKWTKQVRNKETSDNTTAKTVSIRFRFLVDHATEMASLLQSLISHYDLCITALKHTEGGGEAARLAMSVPNSSSGIDGMLPAEDSLYHTNADSCEAISEDERRDMLSVLDNDAQQVADVTDEINDRLGEMETELLALVADFVPAETNHVQLAGVVVRLKQLDAALLPQCPTAATDFREKWASIRGSLTSQTKDLSSLAGFYENFVRSHSALMREIDRRELVRSKISSIAERARRDIEALHAEDQDMRSQFLKDVGEYLPRDIWPDIMTGPERWVIKTVDGHFENEEGLVGQVPAGRVIDRPHGHTDDDDDDDDDDVNNDDHDADDDDDDDDNDANVALSAD